MKKLPNILQSAVKIRFQDCDPFNHLNNAAYLNYFVNAREDQILEHYEIDIYKMARTEGKSWVVASNQISYINPAFLMEEVIIESQVLKFDTSSISIEMKMWNKDKTKIKAVMWSTLVYFNLMKQKREQHSEELMNLFNSVLNPIKTTQFEIRINYFKKNFKFSKKPAII
ncbi:MAG: thioesterase [Flavobacteriaceae bacterium]|jgi:YbgC/YbaW family acyl-CoA thioester hydrolase|nr:thioesterase [Flavobacteriaceae bacterium]MDG1329748.1 acyl-CoA thioesterase [Flavobacteriaceae bacterium]|tara:strand:+ start:708 stop:1217 length:510 start_codon:yes stop_codon:yes gene_type:complete